MRVIVFLSLFVLISCGRQDPSLQIEKLNGYWEIKSVAMPNGDKRDFGISTTIDFIEVTGDRGVRKKVTPKLDGSFLVNNSAEKFTLKIEEDSLRMYYETPFDSWKETVMQVEDSLLKVKNRDQKIYSYKRFSTFNFN